jgi:hypothetical protein
MVTEHKQTLGHDAPPHPETQTPVGGRPPPSGREVVEAAWANRPGCACVAPQAGPGGPPRQWPPLEHNLQVPLGVHTNSSSSNGSHTVRQSKSPLEAPVFFIKKKDGKLRFVQDYRALNAITRKNRYPLPLIDDLIHRLKDACYFTKLDVRWGYNNVRIRKADEWKAAFRTNRGLFEPLVMYFGLTNSPATFQTMMNEIFQDLITEGVVSVYLDDILIFTNSLEEHCRVTRLVLDRMREHKLYLRPEKCEFEKTKIEYLGVIISHNKVEMDPVKIAGVADWPTPSNKKEVQSFVGFVNFYRHFIPGFSHHARALFDLTMKDVRFNWGLPQEDSFMKLKELVTSAPVLVLPNDNLPFVMKVMYPPFCFSIRILVMALALTDTITQTSFSSKSLLYSERSVILAPMD